MKDSISLRMELLKRECEELHAMQLAMSATLFSLIATHPDRSSFLAHMQGHRAAFEAATGAHFEPPPVRKLALDGLAYFCRDTPTIGPRK
jgi:hypothetical protein